MTDLSLGFKSHKSSKLIVLLRPCQTVLSNHRNRCVDSNVELFSGDGLSTWARNNDDQIWAVDAIMVY